MWRNRDKLKSMDEDIALSKVDETALKLERGKIVKKMNHKEFCGDYWKAYSPAHSLSPTEAESLALTPFTVAFTALFNAISAAQKTTVHNNFDVWDVYNQNVKPKCDATMQRHLERALQSNQVEALRTRVSKFVARDVQPYAVLALRFPPLIKSYRQDFMRDSLMYTHVRKVVSELITKASGIKKPFEFLDGVPYIKDPVVVDKGKGKARAIELPPSSPLPQPGPSLRSAASHETVDDVEAGASQQITSLTTQEVLALSKKAHHRTETFQTTHHAFITAEKTGVASILRAAEKMKHLQSGQGAWYPEIAQALETLFKVSLAHFVPPSSISLASSSAATRACATFAIVRSTPSTRRLIRRRSARSATALRSRACCAS